MRENRKEAEKALNEKFAKYLKSGEKIKVDHFDNSIINKSAIEKAREAIKQRRLSDINNYRKQKFENEQFNALLNIRNDKYTQRAVRVAMQRMYN